MKDTIEIKQITQLAVQFLAPQSLSFTYRRIVQETVKLYGAVNGSLYLNEAGHIESVYSTIPKNKQIKPRKGGYIHQTLISNKSFVLTRQQFEKHHKNVAYVKDFKSIAIISLTYLKKTLGVLTLQFDLPPKEVEKLLPGFKLIASVASLAIRKNHLYLQSQQALKSRDLFISLAAHELRTPLTTSNILIDRLKLRVEKNVLPPFSWMITLKKEMIRMTRLVNELLQVDQIDKGKFIFEFNTIDLNTLLSQVEKYVSIRHPERTLKVVTKENLNEILIVADQNKLFQVVTNIIDNSVKFSPVTSPLRMTIEREKRKVNITITDFGSGIDKEILPHIFDGFYKAHPETKEGMGLGLYLARRIVRAHKGTIEAKSKLGKWTKFTITLPIVT